MENKEQKDILYISNISVPYRTSFFEEFGMVCKLDVLYERKKSANRNSEWSDVDSNNYGIHYLKGIKIGNENGFDFRIFSYLRRKYKCIIFGCYNSPLQLLAMLYMRLTKKKYILNIDGEVFEPKSRLKKKIRDFCIRGAAVYLCAGTKAIKNINAITKSDFIVPYFFSSLSMDDFKNSEESGVKRNSTILCVGQYEEYKGLDILLNAAKELSEQQFLVVGMGKKAGQFSKLVDKMQLKNVTVIPFLSKEELIREYQEDAMLVLPSRQECWGLVINEGAAYGIPIISTNKSGAAIEFLSDQYPNYLAKSGDAHDLAMKIQSLLNAKGSEVLEYSNYLKDKSKNYSIEHMVKMHAKAVEVFYTIQGR